MSVAILGLGLTAILSAQAGAFASANHGRNISVSVGLLRCKMTEIEELHLRNGFQASDETGSGPCCEGDETPNIKCAWITEKPQLPEAKFGELNLDSALSGSSGSAGGPLDFAPPTDPGDIAGAAAGGMSGMYGMVMQLIYPSLKLIFEASTRRTTVTLTWREGTKSFSTNLVQWEVNPRLGFPGDAPEGP